MKGGLREFIFEKVVGQGGFVLVGEPIVDFLHLVLQI